MTTLGRLRQLDPHTLALQLGAVRTVAGAVIVAAPVPAARLFGADPATARRVTWLTRMMGVRDGAIGVGTVRATRRGRDAGAWLVAGGASDALDAVVVLGAVRSGRIRGVLPLAIVTVAAGSAAAHAVAARAAR